MKVLLVFDKEFPVDTAKLIGYLRKNLQHIQFSLHEDKFELPDLIVRKPETFNKISKELNQIMNQFDNLVITISFTNIKIYLFFRFMAGRI